MENKYAKPFVAILTSRLKLRDEIIKALEMHLGKTDFIGPWRVFDHTAYYTPEMGEGLKRCLVSFDKCISMGEAASLKHITKEVEDTYRRDGKRSVNLDPGYVDLHKVMLASGKGGGHMIMLAKDVFLDFLLWYNKGWQTLPWTYPDFRNGIYFEELENIRDLFKHQMAGRVVTGGR